jgi:hypothetical protein
MVDPFSFKRPEEAFGNSIIVTIALAAHATYNTKARKDFPVICRGILAAPV